MKKATCSKQADPLSSLLFDNVLQKALKDDLPDEQKKRGMGICLGDKDHDSLTNIRFADDVLLFASSKEQLQKMMCDFNAEKKKWVSKHIRQRRKFSVTKVRTVEKIW